MSTVSENASAVSGLKLVTETKVNGTIPVFKYVSERSGLTIVLAHVEGPLVNGYFTLATEAHDDDGLPHTLEHLVFLGSELYPFKGVLDLLANRCLASGTNAWTDTDHTCYNFSTAGPDGFLELLPIYLDHVLHPTLSEAGYTTEVHHVCGDGDDGGVVYCEMQGRENSGESLAHLHLMRLAYPGSGYSAETGGILHNLRTSTSNAKVRAYHREFYRADNLTIIIAGQVGVEAVAVAIEPVVQRIVQKRAESTLEPFVRPWQTEVQPLTSSQNVRIAFPSDEEDAGIVSVGWRGPNSTADNLRLTACSVLLRYLKDTPVSPLQREMVETADPMASQISHAICENLVSFMYVTFENVPMDKIDAVPGRLAELLADLAEGREPFDMQRMRSIIERSVLEYLNGVEGNPHDTVAFLSIADALYGQTAADFETRLNVNWQLEHLKTKDAAYWVQLLREYLVDGHTIAVRAAPSTAEQARLAAQEVERVDRQRALLGPEGLAERADALQRATELNGRLPPNEMLTQVPIPSAEGIRFHPLVKWVRQADGSSAAGQPECFRLDRLPCHAEAYDLHTNFVYMFVTMNTDRLNGEQRSLLILLLDLLCESPVRQADGVLMPYEDVVAALERDTISLGTYVGLESASQFSCGPFSDSCTLTLQVEPAKYELGVRWIGDLLLRSEFTADRIRVCASKITNAVAQAKRKGNAVASELLKAMFYADDSNVRCASMLRQQRYLGDVLERLGADDGHAERVIADLQAVRALLTRPDAMSVHVAADWQRLSALNGGDLTVPWLVLGQGEERPDGAVVRPLDIKFDYELFGEPTKTHGTVVGLGCVESAFLYHATPSIRSFDDPDLPALMLFLQYLTQLEGALWRQIRGQGYAYGYNLVPRPNEGLLYFTLYRATNVVAAYKETRAIVERQASAEAEWDGTLLESAKSSLIFVLIEREKSVGDLVVQALLGSFKRTPVEYNRELVRRVMEVSVADLRRVGQQYVTKLFGDDANARTSIVCHPDKAADVAEAFAQIGRNLKVETSLDGTALGQCDVAV